ncbi:three component ABC system middle component [Delftia acidovorans]|uniref:three component ABC system middle component n=1 Tax=Delftia acidovorans TaxID=80866 RepID=UPI0012D81832
MNERLAMRRVPADAAALFNPAYFAAILHRLCSGYQFGGESGIPYALPFLALPIVLHEASAECLPPSARSRLHSWLLDNPEILIGFADRARSLAPFVRDAISFALKYQIIQLVESDRLAASKSTQVAKWEKQPYNSATAKRAVILGKLLSQINEVSTVFTLFGVRP